VFSDADAMLAPNALRLLLRHFQDAAVGGACGQRIIQDPEAWADGGQTAYIAHDSRIKMLETRLGSITSNDGKLYAIRRELYQPIPEAVTDDLFVCLSVVHQHYRFIFDPAAIVNIRVPSRSRAHEFQRRRRIVSTSLRGICYHGALLNPMRFGWYAPQLFINKIMRRLLPVYGLGILAGLGVMAAARPVLRWPWVLGVIAGVLALLWPVGFRMPRLLRPVGKLADTVHYLCLGQVGMLCGVLDFLCRRKIIKWEPNKGSKVTEP